MFKPHCPAHADAATLLRQALLLHPAGSWQLETGSALLQLSPEAATLAGHPGRSSLPLLPLLRKLAPAQRTLVFAAGRRLLAGGADEVVELSLEGADGVRRCLRLACGRLSDGPAPCLGGLLQDDAERRALTERIALLGNYDPITALPNRSLFDLMFGERVAQRAQTGAPLAFLIVDLRRFREVNFSLSHAVGDELLRLVAARIAALLRPRDVVSRVGTRFPILLQDADGAAAARCAHAICSALEEPFAIGGIACEIGAHIGIALCPQHAGDYRGLLRKADIAVEQAAHKGQPVAIYEAAADRHSPDRLGLVGDFRQAVQQGDIRLYCQPKIAMRSGTVIGAEVLARWYHPVRGMIAPDDFVGLIEGTELIHVLTHYMLAEAAACLLRWQDLGIAVPLAVNLSTQDVATPALARFMAELLRTSRLDPSLIELEVTERSLIKNPAACICQLKRLRDMGCRLSIDDYGTGYSSLSYLTQLPVAVIKIDHSFTMKMVDDPRAAAIVRSTIHMAHDLDLTVVAEGTADRAIWNALAALDCDEAQGYYIARPMPIEAFSQWLERAGARFRLPAPQPQRH